MRYDTQIRKGFKWSLNIIIIHLISKYRFITYQLRCMLTSAERILLIYIFFQYTGQIIQHSLFLLLLYTDLTCFHAVNELLHKWNRRAIYLAFLFILLRFDFYLLNGLVFQNLQLVVLILTKITYVSFE